MSSGRSESYALGPVLSAALVLAAGATTLNLVEAGPLSLQMAQHLLIMNVIAPLTAVWLARRRPFLLLPPGAFWPVGFAQLGLLWAWHAPSLQGAAAASPGWHFALLAALLAIAVAFWRLLLDEAATGGWRSLACLLLTGKVACLLGALLVFAPRDLYGLPGLVLPFCATGPSTLADQQLAGLLMITACPLSYLVAGVVLAAQMLGKLDDPQPDTGGRGVVALR